jgi:hypothetical protein
MEGVEGWGFVLSNATIITHTSNHNTQCTPNYNLYLPNYLVDMWLREIVGVSLLGLLSKTLDKNFVCMIGFNSFQPEFHLHPNNKI